MDSSKIEKLYTWISDDGKSEGICSCFHDGEKAHYPMVSKDWKLMLRARPLVEAMAAEFGIQIKLVEFSTRTVLDPDKCSVEVSAK